MNPPLCSQVVPFTLFACFLGTLFNFASARFISTNDINATIAATPQSAVKQVGTNVAFNCSVTGHLPPSAIIQWDKNTLPKGSITRMLDDRTSQLILSNVQLEDAQPGYYTCCLVLQDGRCSSIEAHVRLKVGFLPAPVRNLTCFSHNFDVGICTWNNPERDSIIETTYTLERRFHTKKEESDWETVEPCYNESLDTTAENMCAWHNNNNDRDRSHSYQVVSENALGEIATIMTNPSTFNVHHDAVPYPPHSITVQSVSSRAVHVTWKPPEDFYTWLVEYRLRYNTTFNSWIEEEVGKSKQFDKNNLHPPYALVCVQLASRQSSLVEERGKWSEWSKSQCSRLGEEKPATKPVIITSVVKVNENERNLKDVDLSWKPLPKDKQNGKILGYNISVTGYLNSFTTENRQISVPENVTQCLIPDLNRTLEYKIFISAYNSKGSSPAANVTVEANPFILPESIPDTLAAYVVPVAVLLLLLVCFTTYWSWKKITKKTFEVQMPDIVMQSNTYNNVVSTAFHAQEPEYFDEVKVIRSQLYVNMDIADESFSRSEVAVYQNCLGQKGYSLENTPLLEGGIRSEASEQMDTLQSAATRLLSGASNSEQYSPRSVGSGGSYWSTKDDNDVIYKRMTPQGLSPIDKCSPGNQWDQGEDRDQSVDNGADNDSCGGGSAIDVYVKQSSILGMPGMNNHSRSSSQNLSQHLLAVPTPSGISASSRANSQESDIDNYVQQGQLEASLSKQSCEKSMEKKKACLDQGRIGSDKRDDIGKTTSPSSSSRSTSEIHLSPMANYVRSGTCPENLCIGGSANSLQSEQSSSASEIQPGPVANYVQTGTQPGDLDIDCLSSQNNEQSQRLHETPSNPVSNYVQSGALTMFSHSDNSTDSSQSDDEQSQTSTESHSSSVAHYVKSAAYPEDLHIQSSTCSSQSVEQLQSPNPNFVAHMNSSSMDYISGRDLPSSGSPQVPQIIESEACCCENSNTLGNSNNSSPINHTCFADEASCIQFNTLSSYLPKQSDEPEYHHTQVTDDISAPVFAQTSGASYDGFAVTVSQASPGGSSIDLNSSQTDSETSAMESGYGSLTKNGGINDSSHTEPGSIMLTMPEISASDDNLFVLPQIAEDFRSSSNPSSHFDTSPQSNGYVPHNAVLGRSGKPPALQSVSPQNSDFNSGYVAHDRLRPSGTVQSNLVPTLSRSRRESDDGYSSSYGNGTPPDTPNVQNENDLSQNHTLEEDVSQIEMNDLSVRPSQGTHSGYVAHSAV